MGTRGLFLLLVTLGSLPFTSFAQSLINQSPFSGLAIHGYDTVSYFTTHSATPGNRDITVSFEGVEWAFSNKKNLALFQQSPYNYIPQYGGYCAYAASQNAISDVDPTAWQIENGKLYLNYDHKVQRLWANKILENISQGDQNWPRLRVSLE